MDKNFIHLISKGTGPALIQRYYKKGAIVKIQRCHSKDPKILKQN